LQHKEKAFFEWFASHRPRMPPPVFAKMPRGSLGFRTLTLYGEAAPMPAVPPANKTAEQGGSLSELSEQTKPEVVKRAQNGRLLLVGWLVD
jgi:hypothetical protein